MEAATLVDGNGTETGHIIVITNGGKNGQPKQVCVCVWFIIFFSYGTTKESMNLHGCLCFNDFRQ
jgi:hypothetical protein